MPVERRRGRRGGEQSCGEGRVVNDCGRAGRPSSATRRVSASAGAALRIVAGLRNGAGSGEKYLGRRRLLEASGEPSRDTCGRGEESDCRRRSLSLRKEHPALGELKRSRKELTWARSMKELP